MIPKATGTTPGQGTISLIADPNIVVNQFAFGRMSIGDVALLVNSNTTTSATVLNFTNRNIVVPSGAEVILYDDDDFNGDDSPILLNGQLLPYEVDGDLNEDLVILTESLKYLQSEDGVHEDGLPRNVYASAYLRPEYNWAQSVVIYNQSNIAFTLNVGEVSVPDAVNANRNSINDEKDEFWIAYLLIAYQGGENEDADGELSSTSGISSGSGSATIVCDCWESASCVGTNCSSTNPQGLAGSLIFQETMQDFTRSYFLALGTQPANKGTTAPHELGHQLGLKGDNKPNRSSATFNMMDYPNRTQNQTDDYSLHEEHINIIRRRIKSPGL